MDYCLSFWPLYYLSFCSLRKGSPWSWSYCSWIYNYLCNQCLSPLMLWVRISMRSRCTTLCDKVCQWLATGRWFSPAPPVSYTNKTDHHDIAEILLKVELSTIRQASDLRKPISPLVSSNFYWGMYISVLICFCYKDTSRQMWCMIEDP